MGTEWLWEAECLPRAVLIARALATGNRSFQHAATILAGAGYAPSALRLRMVLLDRLAAYKQPMVKRQTYLVENHSLAEKHRRLTNHLRRRMVDLPDSAFQPLTVYIGALFGVIAPDNPHVTEEIRRFQQFFSIPALQQRLETIDDPVLLEKYEEAGRAIPSLIPLVAVSINSLLLPLFRQQLQHAGLDTSTLPTSIDLETLLETTQLEAGRTLTSNPMIGGFRLYLAIFLMAIPAKDTTLLIQWNEMFLGTLSQVLNHFGISLRPMTSLLESANPPSA